MKKIYGYCRISHKSQNIQRQLENIIREYPEAILKKEVFTGTTTDRKEWNQLKKIVRNGDTIIFDSVSRMSRNSEDGIQEYFELMDKGIKLVFLKEGYINTEVYNEQLKANESLKTDDTDLNDTILRGIREYLKVLATKQIKIAFDQSQKEVDDLRQRTKEGLKVAKANGKQIGREKGATFNTKKSVEMKQKIEKLSKDFNGTLKDIELMELLKISRNTFYKYKKELLTEN